MSKQHTPEVQASLAKKRRDREETKKVEAERKEKRYAIKSEIDQLNAQKAAITKRLRVLVHEHDAL